MSTDSSGNPSRRPRLAWGQGLNAPSTTPTPTPTPTKPSVPPPIPATTTATTATTAAAAAAAAAADASSADISLTQSNTIPLPVIKEEESNLEAALKSDNLKHEDPVTASHSNNKTSQLSKGHEKSDEKVGKQLEYEVPKIPKEPKEPKQVKETKQK